MEWLLIMEIEEFMSSLKMFLGYCRCLNMFYLDNGKNFCWGSKIYEDYYG